MKDLHGPQTRVFEGAYAIKVSMRVAQVSFVFFYTGPNGHGPFIGITIRLSHEPALIARPVLTQATSPVEKSLLVSVSSFSGCISSRYNQRCVDGLRYTRASGFEVYVHSGSYLVL
jgi:hypothetical protein